MVEQSSLYSKFNLRGKPSFGLVAGTIAFFAGFAAVALFGVSAHHIAKQLNLSIEEVGWLVAIPMVTGAFLRIPFSAWVDKYGGKPILLTQLIIAVIGVFGLSFIINEIFASVITNTGTAYILLLIFGALAGTGVSTFSSGITYVSYWYPQNKQGFALGAYAGFGNSAPGIFTAILPFALASLGIVLSYVSWGIFLAIMIVVFAIIGYDSYYFQIVKKKKASPEEARKVSIDLGLELFPSGNAAKSLKDSAKEWRVWLLVVMYFISFGGFEALTEWFPSYWRNYMGISPIEAGLLTGIVFSLVTALIRVPGGVWSDKLGGELVAIISYAILVVGSLIMISSSVFGVSVGGEIIMAIGMGIANAAVYKLVPKYSISSVGGASGWVGGLGSAGGLLIPPTMAAFVSAYGNPGYATGFLVFTIIGIVAILFAIILIKKQGTLKEIRGY